MTLADKILKITGIALCAVCAVLALALIMLSCIANSARKAILDETAYKDFLLSPAVQKKIDAIIIQTSGLEQLRMYDETVYGNIFYLMKTELVAPFTNTLPELVVQYIAGKTNTFDPVLNLQEVRGKAKWILDQAVNQKVPSFLLERMQRSVNRIFNRYVPMSMRILPMLGVTPPMEEKMQAYVAKFQELSAKRHWLYTGAAFFALMWFVLMRKKINFPGNLAASLGAASLCVALPITLFGRQLIEIAQTALLQSGRAVEEYQAFVGAILPKFFKDLSGLLFIIAAACAILLLCLLLYKLSRHWIARVNVSKNQKPLRQPGFFWKRGKNFGNLNTPNASIKRK